MSACVAWVGGDRKQNQSLSLSVFHKKAAQDGISLLDVKVLCSGIHIYQS